MTKQRSLMDEIAVGQREANEINARERALHPPVTREELNILLGPIDKAEAKEWKRLGVKNRLEAMQRRGLIPVKDSSLTPDL